MNHKSLQRKGHQTQKPTPSQKKKGEVHLSMVKSRYPNMKTEVVHLYSVECTVQYSTEAHHILYVRSWNTYALHKFCSLSKHWRRLCKAIQTGISKSCWWAKALELLSRDYWMEFSTVFEPSFFVLYCSRFFGLRLYSLHVEGVSASMLVLMTLHSRTSQIQVQKGPRG